MLSCRGMAQWLSTHSPTACGGGRWWRQPPKGECISNARRAVVRFSPPKAAFILAPQRAPTSPAERCYIPPEGGALNPPVRRSRSQAEPWQPRAERPGGWLNPHARKGVSTFGNTAPRRFLTKVHDFRRRRCPIAIPPLPPIWCIIKKNSLFVSPREGVLHA